MTFPEALRELAWLRPEKFPELKYWFDYVFDYRPAATKVEVCLYFPEQFADYLAGFTQDKIDITLLQLGRRVLLRESVDIDAGSLRRVVRLVATIFDTNWNRLATVETNETEKNPAMQKALVAVVEELAKENGV